MRVTPSVTPTVTIQALPDAVTIVGAPITFSVETETFEGLTPTYTWQISDDFGVTWTTYTSGPSPSFTITATTLWNLRRVRVLLTSSYTAAPVVPPTVPSNVIIVIVTAQLPNGVWLTGTYNNIYNNWLGITSSGIVSANPALSPLLSSKLPYVVNKLEYKPDSGLIITKPEK
jgi:hypothetical protein